MSVLNNRGDRYLIFLHCGNVKLSCCFSLILHVSSLIILEPEKCKLRKIEDGLRWLATFSSIFQDVGCVPLRISKVGFLSPKESENGFAFLVFLY